MLCTISNYPSILDRMLVPHYVTIFVSNMPRKHALWIEDVEFCFFWVKKHTFCHRQDVIDCAIKYIRSHGVSAVTTVTTKMTECFKTEIQSMSCLVALFEPSAKACHELIACHDCSGTTLRSQVGQTGSCNSLISRIGLLP